MVRRTKTKQGQSRKPWGAKEKKAFLDELARNQSEDPMFDVEYITSVIRSELGQWKEKVPDIVTEQASPSVSFTYAISNVVRSCVAAFKKEFIERAELKREIWIADIAIRHPNVNAERVFKILVGAAASLHGQEAAKAFVRLLPEFAAMAVTLAGHSAFAHARDAANRYSPRDISTGEEVYFEFTEEERAAYREEIAERAARETRGILKGLKRASGRRSEIERDVAAYMRRKTLQDELKSNGVSTRIAETMAKAQVQAEFPALRHEKTYQGAMRRGKAECVRRHLVTP